MKLGIAGDFHAGYGKDDPEVRTMMATATRRSAEFLGDQALDELVLNGDVTDHLANGLAHETDEGLCLSMCAPIVRLIEARRRDVKTTVLAGNTDWVLASPFAENREIFFNYTGISPTDVTIPEGGLEYLIETEQQDVIDINHGNAQKPKVWGHEGQMERPDQEYLMEMLQQPTPDFLQMISAIDGSHREDFFESTKDRRNRSKTPPIRPTFFKCPCWQNKNGPRI